MEVSGEMIRRPVAIVASARNRAEAATTAEELERDGQPVTIVCLDTSRHEHEPSRADVVHVPRFSAGMIAAFVSRPGLFPRAAYVARMLERRGIAEVRGSARIAKLLHAAPADLSELPVEWSRLGERLALRWFSRHINSITAELSIDGDRRVVVKRVRSNAGGAAADRWSHERRMLLSLGESMRDGFHGVPRVLLEDRERAMMVMESAPGTPLNLLFIAAASDRAVMPRLAAGVRGAGAWVAAMQHATRRDEDGGALLDELTRIAVEDAKKLGLTRVVPFLESGQRSLRTRGLAVTAHHDDYWPGNIFVDGERVTVIDFESSRDGLELEDPAFFLIRCEMLRRRFRLRFPDLARRFFEGYGRQPDAEELRFFTVTKGLRLLARGAGEELPPPQRIWTRRTIRGIVLGALHSG